MFFLADKGSRGTSQNLFFPLTVTWVPSIKAYKGGKYDKKKVHQHQLPPWVVQLLIFYILHLSHFSSLQVFYLFIKVNSNNLSTFQTGKIHENFQYLFNKIGAHFQKFSPRRRGPGRGLGGLYSIECPRIGGKKTISLKRFFPPTRAPAGLLKICYSRSLSREARRTSRQTEHLRAKQNLWPFQDAKNLARRPRWAEVRQGGPLVYTRLHTYTHATHIVADTVTHKLDPL